MSNSNIATNDDPEADLHTDDVIQPKTKTANNPICHDCDANITQRVADYSASCQAGL